MKYAVIGLLLSTGAAQAESQCLLTDERRMLAELDGFWDISGSLSMTAQGDTFVDPFEARMRITRDGTAILYMNDGRGDTVPLNTDEGSFDAEDMAKLFEMTQADWVAEAVANSPFPPEDLIQYRYTLNDPNGDYNKVTIIPYFSYEMVMVLDVETVGDLGLTFITMVGLMTPVSN